MTIPRETAVLLERLNQSGYEAYAVGGCVRDMLLGREPQDWDLCTSALPEQTAEVFSDYRLVTDGMIHGTVGVVCSHGVCEITTYRTESGYTDSRHPDRVAFVRTLKEDLARRDFTVNAMAYHPDCGVVDLYGGQKDLQKGVLRCVGDPAVRFGEDALRILRALRFASVYDFAVEENTAAAALAFRQSLTKVSAERVGSEITRFLCGTAAARLIKGFWPILSVILPEIGGEQSWMTAARQFSGLPPGLALRLALILYPTGELAEQLLKRLRIGKKTAAQVLTLLDTFLPETEEKAALRLYLGCFGQQMAADRLLFDRAVSCDEEKYARRARLLREITENRDCCAVSDLAVTGSDLQALGYAGAAIGRTLQRLLLAVVSDRAENRSDALLTLAESWKEE